MDAQQTENRFEENYAEIEDEEFKCCVCLELMYKPMVLACGHICCFWCVYMSMSSLAKSNCPICRHQYNHFPSVCGLLHFAIQALYPIAYKKRDLQVAEEEKEYGCSSPQLTSYGNSSNFDVNSSANKEETSCSADSSEIIISGKSGCPEVVSKGQNKSEASSSGSKVVEASGETKVSLLPNTLKKLFSVDFLCPACKNILFRPVVLNCGHVHCEHCLSNNQNGNLKCQACESPNPNGLPKVCLLLDNLIAKHFRDIYGQRRESLLKQAGPANEDPSNSASQTSQRTKNSEDNDYALWWTGRGPKVHIRVGCDYCGMSPIIGERYRCLDCKEKIGFDLCEKCYLRSSDLPGRFNQQHRPDHKFELKQPDVFNHVFIRAGFEELDDEDDFTSRDVPDDAADSGLPRTAPPP